jgi:hypothetical protein
VGAGAGLYPRTFHLPDSLGVPSADRVQHDLSWLDGELVVTEKLDGGNLTFTRDAMYARSPGSGSGAGSGAVDGDADGTPPWDMPAKALWAMTAYRIPDGWRVCGESMWARRSIAYPDLPGVFLVFGIWDETDTLLGWDDTVEWAVRLELPTVPVLYRGGSLTEARAAWRAQRDPASSEGYVVRAAGRIAAADFAFKLVTWTHAERVHDPADGHLPDDFETNGFS